jgi:HSP20 family protein
MFIDRCNPLNDFALMGRDMDKIFSEFFPAAKSASPHRKPSKESIEKNVALPIFDMIDVGGAITLSFEVPGVRKEDINISIEKNTLKLTAKRVIKDEGPEKKIYHMERNYSGFERLITLPVKIDPEKTRATLKEGVLEIRIDKVSQAQPKKIKVEAS